MSPFDEELDATTATTDEWPINELIQAAEMMQDAEVAIEYGRVCMPIGFGQWTPPRRVSKHAKARRQRKRRR